MTQTTLGPAAPAESEPESAASVTSSRGRRWRLMDPALIRRKTRPTLLVGLAVLLGALGCGLPGGLCQSSVRRRLRGIKLPPQSLQDVPFDVAVERINEQVRHIDANAPQASSTLPGWQVKLGHCPPELRQEMVEYVSTFQDAFVRMWVGPKPISMRAEGFSAWDLLSCIATLENLELVVDRGTVYFAYCPDHCCRYVCHAYVLDEQVMAGFEGTYGSLAEALPAGRGFHEMGLMRVPGTNVLFYVETPFGHGVFSAALRNYGGYQ